MPEIIDPPAAPEPGEGGSLRAKDLKGHVCIFHPVGEGMWPAKPATDDKPAQDASPYIDCEVWRLDRAGIVDTSTGVRVSWWRAVPQLQPYMNQYVCARVVEQDDRSVILVPLEGEARSVAETALKEIGAEAKPSSDDLPERDISDDLEEPF